MKPVVIMCADAPQAELSRSEVVAIEGLCKSPSRIGDKIGDAQRVVLLLHQSQYDLAEVQKALRTVDVDPLGAQIFDVPSDIMGADFDIAVSGLLSRAGAFAGSRPEHAKPVVRGEVTRRGLFRPPQPVYLAAPMVDPETCAAADGCRACVDVCPQSAYRWQRGKIHFNKDLCEPCGRCVSTCPTEAIANPSVTPAMLAEQIRALIAQSDEPTGLRFVCSRAQLSESAPHWYDIEVPCTGMLPGSWLISALLMGAGSVTAASCSAGGCPLDLDVPTRAAIEFARAALAAASLDPDSVPSEANPSSIAKPVARLDLAAPFTRAGDVEAFFALDSIAAGDLVVEHPASPVGVVAIDAEACTLCAQCAQTCPTGAILAGYEGERVTMSFDAALCTNCVQCTIACPEIERGAISVAGRVDAELLRAGRRTANEGVVLVCESCGAPIAPTSMMDRIGELLGDGFDDTMSYLTRRCMDCRGLS